jgi:hypothetical protein
MKPLEEKPKVEFKRLETSNEIPHWKEVRVTQMNHIYEVMDMRVEPNSLSKVKKISKKEYVNLDTGEIHEYGLNENRAQNVGGLKRTFRDLRHLINNNFVGVPNELHVTTTYSVLMRDVQRVRDDTRLFMDKLRRKYGSIDYINIVEPQESGSWHCHMLLRFNDQEKIFIKNNEVLAPMWGQGFTKIKALKNVDNIGVYLSAYLTDIEINEENAVDLLNKIGGRAEVTEKEVEDENGKKVKKKFVKGARLHFYPSGMNLHSYSKGIKKPETVKMEYSEIKEKVSSTQADFTRTIEISQDGKIINAITYEHYNLKRKNKQ